MKDIGYVLKRLTDMNYSALFEKLDFLHKKTGRSKAFLLWDMLNCAVKYGAGYMDYDLFEMYNLTPAQRDTYITRGRNNALIKKYNDLSYVHYFDNKLEFYTKFAEYLHRQWIRLDDEKEKVLSFIAERKALIAKPSDGACGKGVEKIITADYPDAESIYAMLKGIGREMLLEDVIEQHPAVNAIYPEAINTVRTVTVSQNGKVKVVCTYFRIGNNGRHVDNFNSGGMVAPVDERTGIVKDKAIDKNKNVYTEHPYTGTPIKGFAFPDWEKAMAMVKEAALVVPQMGYVGWDVAFTPNGPCFVECNDFPGHDIYQLPEHTPDKQGMYHKFFID